MKKLFLLFALTAGMVWAQENELKNDTLFLANGGFLVQGQQLKFGKGSKDNGDFRHIEVSTSSMMRQNNTNSYGISSSRANLQEANALSGEFNDLEGKVIRFESRGTKRTGRKYVAIVGIGLPQRYQVDIDNAARVGEIIIPGYNVPSADGPTKTESNVSVADELLKLKQLLDAGLLTEEEFDQQKEKLLGGN